MPLRGSADGARRPGRGGEITGGPGRGERRRAGPEGDRRLDSPDDADALALTFAQQVAPCEEAGAAGADRRRFLLRRRRRMDGPMNGRVNGSTIGRGGALPVEL